MAWFNLNSIVDLQRGLINDLSGNTSLQSQSAINNLAGNLNTLSTTINGSSVLPTLTYQNQVNGILDRENSRLAERKQAIDSSEFSQQRMVDLTNNATMQNKALNKIYVVFAIATLVYLGIRLLVKTMIVPEMVTDIMLIILITLTIIMIINMYYDYNRRNNMNYNMINLGEPAQLNGNASSSSSSKNLLDMRFNGCIKESCCADGTTFNDKYSICVPDLPPINGTNTASYKYFISTKTWLDPVTKCASNGYSLTDLSCNGNTVSGFTTIANSSTKTSDMAIPNGPIEFVDYNLYK